jgi:hypothetical protein
MKSFLDFLKEEAEAEGAKLKHIHHAEDRPLMHGHEGFEHTHGALTQAHEHMKAGKKSSGLTMKYDGSPSVVYGHHPESGKFFVASKSAFNKNPKINYTHEDIEKHHGHAPGLVTKLKSALDHLPKVAPKKGVYQGDIMHSGDVEHHKSGDVSFKPNTITYTAKGEQAKAHKNAKLGVVTHTKYEGKDFASMKATPHVSDSEFKHHPDVAHHTAEHDTSKISYPKSAQNTFQKHMDAAKQIHDTHGKDMYKATEKHRGENTHMTTYINSTVKNDEKPSAEGFQKHITAQGEKAASKVKTAKSQEAKRSEHASQVAHVEANKEHYNNLFAMHHHLQQAKNTLVKHLETHEGGYEHHINGTKSKPEGFVVNHKDEPTKLVNRSEFAKANLLKVKK